MLSSNIVRIGPSRWGVGLAAGVLLLAGGLKWNSERMPDDASVPNPSPPMPNARDAYDRAERLRRDTQLETAVYKLLKAGGEHSPSAAPVPPPGALALERRLVAENLPALALLRQGLTMQYLGPQARSFDATMPYLAADRDMARLLAMQAQTRAAAGDWAGALDTDADGIRFALSLERGADSLGELVATSCASTARQTAWKMVAHLTAPQAHAAARTLLGLSATRVSAALILTEEKWETQGGLLEMWRKRDWRTTANGEDSSDSPQNMPSFSTALRMHLESPRAIYGAYTRYTDEAIRRVALPWPTQLSLKPQPSSSGVIAFELAEPSLYASLACRQDADAALDEMLAVECALRAYRLERGAYPAALDQLVPAYLPGVPIDPFTGGQTLGYRLKAGRPLLYSVGPDVKDDDGVSPIPYQQTGSAYHWPDPSDTGDLLAGAG